MASLYYDINAWISIMARRKLGWKESFSYRMTWALSHNTGLGGAAFAEWRKIR